jgi:hypothetical protein
MSNEGWNLDASDLLGNDADLAELGALAQEWPTLSPAARAERVAQLQARYPDLDLTETDVEHLVATFQRLGDIP